MKTILSLILCLTLASPVYAGNKTRAISPRAAQVLAQIHENSLSNTDIASAVTGLSVEQRVALLEEVLQALGANAQVSNEIVSKAKKGEPISYALVQNALPNANGFSGEEVAYVGGTIVCVAFLASLALIL